MTAREVMARALADIRCNRGKFDGCPRQWCQCRGWSDLTLSALAGAGFAVVPVEATQAMLDAAQQAWTPGMNHADAHAERYRAMLAAAQPAREGGE